MFPELMTELPAPGNLVNWRDPQESSASGCDCYGPGPFEVVDVIDRSHLGLPASIVLRTEVGQREVSELWLEIQ
jgi:hypothetical protein